MLGIPLCEYVGAHPKVGALFARTIANYARTRLGSVVAASDFGLFGMVVGGGNGALLIEILRTYDGPGGLHFDLPPFVERARQNIALNGLADRCTVVGGSAHEPVPEGGDASILSNYLVGIDDARSAEILRRCRDALADRGRVLLVQWVKPAGRRPTPPRPGTRTPRTPPIVAIDGAGGWRARRAEEFRALLQAGGLALTAIISTASFVSVIEARPSRTESG